MVSTISLAPAQSAEEGHGSLDEFTRDSDTRGNWRAWKYLTDMVYEDEAFRFGLDYIHDPKTLARLSDCTKTMTLLYGIPGADITCGSSGAGQRASEREWERGRDIFGLYL